MSSDSTKSATTETVEYKGLDFLGFPEYRVGSDGTVWSRKSGMWSELYPLTASPYFHVHLCPPYKGGPGAETRSKYKQYNIHILILLAFRGPPLPGEVCCHRNDIPTDNRLENLYWGTPKTNGEDRVRNRRSASGEAHGMSKMTNEKVINMRRMYAGGGYTQKELAQLFGISYPQAKLIIRKKRWTNVD